MVPRSPQTPGEPPIPVSLSRTHPTTYQPQLNSRPRVNSVSLKPHPPPHLPPFHKPTSPALTWPFPILPEFHRGQILTALSFRMKRASSLNFLNKSVEEPVQVRVGSGQHPAAEAPASGLREYLPSCSSLPVHLATLPVLSSSQAWLDPGKT